MSFSVGVDIGSTAVKLVFVDEREIIWSKSVPTVPGQEKLVDALIDQGMRELNLEEREMKKLAVTGYGRKLISRADRIVDEISANALGAFVLSGEKARTIINIGGQDMKIIFLSDEGKVADFKMNDKCAAGTGRFFQMAATILDTPLSDFSDLSSKAESPIPINSICAVFAESEIVSLLADNIAKERIINGLHESVARRVGNLIGNMEIEESVYVDGGPAVNQELVDAIGEELLYDVEVLRNPQFTVAYGAALMPSQP